MNRDMNGKARPMPGWAGTQAVPTALERRSHRDRIFDPYTRTSLPNGILQKTEGSDLRTVCREATGLSGGIVTGVMNGRR